jgi:hypothetical protein
MKIVAALDVVVMAFSLTKIVNPWSGHGVRSIENTELGQGRKGMWGKYRLR